jgi:hypothetical protein
MTGWMKGNRYAIANDLRPELDAFYRGFGPQTLTDNFDARSRSKIKP